MHNTQDKRLCIDSYAKPNKFNNLIKKQGPLIIAFLNNLYLYS
jgi:hypothetical protein